MEQKGIVFGIQHFSIHDGPGIRTTVFLKGCNMNCAWCHNPESIAKKPTLAYTDSKCIRCGDCVRVCPQVHSIRAGIHKIDRSKCTCCGRCVQACCQGALSIMGEEMDAGEVIGEALRDKRYFEKSGGGITISGGEPMCQAAFTKALCKKAKEEGVSTAIETNGYADFSEYEKLLPYADLFLIDYKLTDDAKHKKFTGVSGKRILENLKHFCMAGKPVILRCPVIPGVNDTDGHFKAIALLTRQYHNILGFELMPYHKLGMSKAKRIGEEGYEEFEVPDASTVESWTERVCSFGGRIYEADGLEVKKHERQN